MTAPLGIPWLAWSEIAACGFALVAVLLVARILVLTRRLVRWTEKVWKTSPAAIRVTDEQLQILRLLDSLGAFIWEGYSVGASTAYSWSLGGRVLNRFLVNQWFFAAIDQLKLRNLAHEWVDPKDTRTLLSIAPTGAWIVRQSEGRQIREREIIFV
jgi:hypothetical protein